MQTKHKRFLNGIGVVALIILTGCNTREEVEHPPILEKAEPLLETTWLEREDGITVFLSEIPQEIFFIGDEDRSISLETASERGIGQLRNFLGAEIDHMYVEMLRVSSLESRGYDWIGQVAATREDLESGKYLYAFRMNALSSRVYELQRGYEVSNSQETNEAPIDYVAIAETLSQFFSAGRPLLSLEQVESSEHLSFLATLYHATDKYNFIIPSYLEITLLQESGKLIGVRSYFPH